ncbi:S-methyl-5-thioribose-1-phosphate isomerase [Vallitalea sp.]|jgi:methylthioribose-1-phosphate isomerase|uniref:S-methyl-5-thioribose-1-phosphate isomerase n=1 Tax=Vallitalea sp. TaxID=1882829 RepID=UPI0025D96F55|nr:S-methyl-5-thioribose-1-phosphate isomerase [Vallitalea sp.]MCT4686235.1 S-methyl-5-thioribose-1-phosphate isomerase [Vallitalea sp.]
MERVDKGLAFMLRYENVAWYEDGKVKILDRRIYPTEVKYVTCESHQEVAQSIADMVTQSAGPYTAAGMGMALAAFECKDLKEEEQMNYLQDAAYTLSHARPTTVPRMTLVVNGCMEVVKKAFANSQRVDEEIFKHTVNSMNRRYSKIGEVANYLVDMFPQNGNVMTQCFGETIIGMMLKEAKKRNKAVKFFCPETRPFLQGARLTASVIKDQGFEVTVITDNMPAITMQTKNIDLFTSAADSICIDGHIVNKVGTMQIAIVAKYFGIPYFVTGIPDRDIIEKVKIEERNQQEVLEFRGIKNTLDGVKAYYPAFDITPPHLVSGVVTDKGIYSPYDLKRYFATKVDNYW